MPPILYEPKISPICIDLNRYPISVIYISIDLNKPVTCLLGLIFNSPYLYLHLHVEGSKHCVFKSIDCRIIDLSHNTQFHVYPYVDKSIK